MHRVRYEQNIKGYFSGLHLVFAVAGFVGAKFFWEDASFLPWYLLSILVWQYLFSREAKKEVERLADLADRQIKARDEEIMELQMALMSGERCTGTAEDSQ